MHKHALVGKWKIQSNGGGTFFPRFFGYASRPLTLHGLPGFPPLQERHIQIDRIEYACLYHVGLCCTLLTTALCSVLTRISPTDHIPHLASFPCLSPRAVLQLVRKAVMSQAAGGNNLRCVVFGSGGVGKSSIVLRFVTDTFSDDYLPTIEDSYRKTVQYNGKTTQLDILDTAGQEEFSSARDEWVRNGQAFCLVYSITSARSFKDVHSYREHILLVNEGKQAPPMVLVGNKSDKASERQVSAGEARRLAESYGNIPLLETSALDGTNCSNVFYEIIRLVREREEERNKAQPAPKPKKFRCTIL